MKKFLLLLRHENGDVENHFYIQAIKKYGGSIVFVSDDDCWEDILEKLEEVEGILLPGGDDVGPWDYSLIQYALDHQLKLLGICQGMQSMALCGTSHSLVAIGNSSHYAKKEYLHDVSFKEGSRIQELLGRSLLHVNSYHYQTVADSFLFSVVGRSEDGLIEVVENSNHKFQIGVQWHPERMIDYDLASQKLLDSFIRL